MFFAKLRTTFTKKKSQAGKNPKSAIPRSKKSSWFSWLQFKRKKNIFSDGTERVNQGTKESRRFSSYFATTPKLDGLDLGADAATLKKQQYRKSAPVFPSVQSIADLGSGLITTPQDLVPQSSCVVVFNHQGQPVTSDHLLPSGEYSTTRHTNHYKDPHLLRKASLKQRATEVQFKGPLLRVSESQRFDKTGRTSLSLQGTALSVSSALARRTSSRNSLARSRSIRSTASRLVNLSGTIEAPMGVVPVTNRSLSSITPTSMENAVSQARILQEVPIRRQVSMGSQLSRIKAISDDKEEGVGKVTLSPVSVSRQPSITFADEGNHTAPALSSVSTSPTVETQSIAPMALSHHEKEDSSGEATTTTGGDTEGENVTIIPQELAAKAESVISPQSGHTDPDPTTEPISPYILPSRILLNRTHSLQNRGYCPPIGIQKRRNTVAGGRTEELPVKSVSNQERVVPLLSRRDSLPHLTKLSIKAVPTSTGCMLPHKPLSLENTTTSSDSEGNSRLVISKRRRRRTIQLTWPVAVSPWGTLVTSSQSILVPMKSSIYPGGSLLPSTTRRRSDYSWVCEHFADQLQDPLSTASWVLSASRELHVSPLQRVEQQGGSVDTELYTQSSHLGDTSSSKDVAGAQRLPLERDHRKSTPHKEEAPVQSKNDNGVVEDNPPSHLKDSPGLLDLSHVRAHKSSRVQLASLPNLPAASGCRHRSRRFSRSSHESVRFRRPSRPATGLDKQYTDNQSESPAVLHHGVPYFLCIYDYDPRQVSRYDGLRYRTKSLIPRHCRPRRPIRTQSLRKLHDRRPISLLHHQSRPILKRDNDNPHLLFIAHHHCVPDTHGRLSPRPTGSVLLHQGKSAKPQADIQVPRQVTNHSSTHSDSSHNHPEKVPERAIFHRASKSLENLVPKSAEKDLSTPSTHHARRRKRHTLVIPDYNFKVRNTFKPENGSPSYGGSNRVMAGILSEEVGSDDVSLSGLTHTLPPTQTIPIVTT
ncbi:hypothetical protein IWQ61_006383 [Dispira simplex]|nr:hypothetical protein IWQ61_006383 [Dispira simplex]